MYNESKPSAQAQYRHGFSSMQAFFVAMPVAAQEDVAWERFFPLEIGNVWEYGKSEDGAYGADHLECVPSGDAEYRFEVTGDTLIDGNVYALVTHTHGNHAYPGFPGGIPGSVCAMRSSEGGDIDHVSVVGVEGWSGCRWFPGFPSVFGVDEPYDPVIAHIGEDVAEVDAEKRWCRYGCEDSVPYYFSYLSDIGFYQSVDVYGGHSGYFSCRMRFLTYARVNGIEYGIPSFVPVTNESEATPVAFALGEAYPNPFRSAVALTLTLPTTGPVTLEAFDVLGHRVLELDLGVQPMGETRHTIDGAALAPGMYFVRVTTASGQSATRRVVRVE
jgi:hypothetical protein